MIRPCFSIGIISILAFCFLVCSLQKPTSIDATVTARFVVIDTSGTLAPDSLSTHSVVPYARIRMNSIDYSLPLYFEADGNGIVELTNERAARYRISAEKFLDVDYWIRMGQEPRSIMLSGSLEKDLFPQREVALDTIEVGVSYLSSIVINEIYYAGPAKSGLYFSDQFIELCNTSSDTQYLDQLLICRMADDNEYPGHIEAIRYYQFPGNGTDYPITPGQLVVVAQDAIDHVHVGGADSSIDLSGADWEFYNQLYPDLDNPNVPNVTNASSEPGGWDFMISLTSDEVCLIRIDDLNAVPFTEGVSRLFTNSSVVDGVEYASDADAIKSVDPRIDAGFAGYQVQRYGGKSIERHHPETGAAGYDTNNSSFDFVSLYHPTPGWQHRTEDIIPRKR